MQVVDSEGYLKVKLVGGPVGPFVPYTGATANVDLGEYQIKAGQVEFDQTPTGTAGVATMRWNDQDGTADLGLKGGNVTLQIGQEQVTRVVNKTGVNLLEANYQAVRVDGAQGNRLKVALAQADNDANSADTLGLVTETINDNQEGFVTTSGLVRNIDTTGTLQGETWADGNVLYLSGTTAGRITNVKPSAPTHTVIMGYVVRAHATQGQIYVKVDNGYELDELHNVAITSPTNDQVLQYESATSLWKNKTISTGITIGTTAIASGVVGRVLFEGAGNVVQESSSLFWDATNNRLGIGTSTPLQPLHVTGRVQLDENIILGSGGATNNQININATGSLAGIYSPSYGSGPTSVIQFKDWNGTESMRVTATRNLLIGTTTDAGFRLDVNGTARVSGLVTLNSNIILNAASATNSIVHSSTFSSSKFSVLEQLSGQNIGGFIINSGTGESRFGSFRNGGGYYTTFYVNNAELIRLSTSNNVLINTTTDAGFRLDVNGTARATQITATTFGGSFNVGSVNVVDFGDGLRIGYSSSVSKISLFTNSGTQGLQVNNGSVSIGPQLTPNASAILDLTSTTKGFLPPRMTTTQRNAIASPVAGLMVYDTTLNVIMYYNGSMWI